VSQATEVATTTALLKAQDIGVRFGGVHALRDINLSFMPGEICGLIGPNGAGKTTLLDCLSGVRLPSSGSVFLGDDDVTTMTPTDRARMGLRRTFQRQQTFGWLTVEDNVLVALEWRGGSGGFLADLIRAPSRLRLEAERRQRVMETLELCGLSDDRSTLAGSLPIGKARLLELARAIVDTPRVLLLDEPTSGLDHDGSSRLGEILGYLKKTHSCSVVLVEHDMRFVMNFCERLVVLDLGELLADGVTAEVRSRPEVVTAYLG
jgi:branched-chain amino acid transport system ATP-binding protein